MYERVRAFMCLCVLVCVWGDEDGYEGRGIGYECVCICVRVLACGLGVSAVVVAQHYHTSCGEQSPGINATERGSTCSTY